MKTKFKKNGRRLLAAILCLVMAVMALPMSAFAWTSEEGVSCTSSFGDYYVGSDGGYYRSKSSYSFIVYDSDGNTSVRTISAGNAKRKYLMTDGSGTHQVYCVESGIDFNTGNSYVSQNGKNSSYFRKLPTEAQFGVMMALMYGWHEGKSSPVAGTNTDDYAFATQTIIWEYQQQLRTSPSDLHSANGIDADTYCYSLKGRPAEKCYDWILSQMASHYTIPSFAARNQNKADTYNVEVCYRRLVTNSVAFMLMSRCGLDANEHFDREDFEGIINFNTPATINALGIATSDISEMALKEISLAIQNLQIAEKDANRTFVPESKSQYNKGRIQPERSENNERNHLQQAGRLSYSRPDITDRARNSAWQIRTDAQELSGAAQASDLSQSADIGQTERASVSDRTDSTPEVGASDEAAFSRTGRNGGTERESPDAVGTENEQHPQPSGGSDYDRADLQVSIANADEVKVNLPTVEEQIEMIAEAEDEKSSAFAVSQEDIDSVLTRGSGFQDGKYRIYRQFQKYEDSKSNIAFLKKEYGTGGGTHLYPDGTNGGEWHDGKGIGIEKHGSYTNPDLRLSWSKVEKRLRELIKANRYLNPKEKDH